MQTSELVHLRDLRYPALQLLQLQPYPVARRRGIRQPLNASDAFLVD